jgi:hypothetical protein
MIGWVALLAIALGLRIGLAIHFPNLNHPDEVYQSLEPAHRLAYGYGVITWEWREGVRSWMFPIVLSGAMRATGWMGSGSYGYTYGVMVVLSLASLSPVWFGYAWAKRASGNEAAIIAAGASAIFFGLVYFAPKALNEVVATDFLLPGLYLGVYGDPGNEKKRLFAAGILLGIAASLRIQLIPAVAFAVVYFCYQRWRQRSPAVLAGLSLPILAFGLVDKLTLSYPWQSAVRYFQTNVTEGRSVRYGTFPWYAYLEMALILLGPVVLFLWQGARRSPLLAIVMLIVIGSHSLLGHKELRYIYPILPLGITLGAIGFVEFATKTKNSFKLPEHSKEVVAAGLLFFVFSSALLAYGFSSWWTMRSSQFAFNRLSLDSTLCGVGLYQVEWSYVGGYSHLHRDVPIVLVFDSAGLARTDNTFNALLAPDGIAGLPSDFKKSDCLDGICVYRRAGTCNAPLPQDALQVLLTASEESRFKGTGK